MCNPGDLMCNPGDLMCNPGDLLYIWDEVHYPVIEEFFNESHHKDPGHEPISSSRIGMSQGF